MTNATVAKFGYPDTLVAQYRHWVVLLRPAQPTLGSLVLAATGEARAFGDLEPGAHAELQQVTRAIETALTGAVRYERINYLMLMMVDPYVHFHVIPRYAGERAAEGIAIADGTYPGPPALSEAVALDGPAKANLVAWLKRHWPD